MKPAVMVFPCFPCCLLGESCRINLAKKLDLEPLEGVPKDRTGWMEGMGSAL